jgi:hypothetical protein
LAGLDSPTTINQVNVANIAKDMDPNEVKEKMRLLAPMLIKKGFIEIPPPVKEEMNDSQESQS